MAAATPTGIATAAVVSMISDVPTQAERMPARSALRDGNSLRKSRLRRGAPSCTRARNSTTSTSRAANMMRRHAMTKSLSKSFRRLTSDRIWRIAASAVEAFMSVGLAELARQREPRDVEDERHEHQHEARGEDRLVADAAVRQVAEAHLD